MDWINQYVNALRQRVNSFFKDIDAKGDLAGTLVGLAIGVYIIAYVLLDAALAVANKTGFSSNLSTLVTTVMPILIIIGAVMVIYKRSQISGK